MIILPIISAISFYVFQALLGWLIAGNKNRRIANYFLLGGLAYYLVNLVFYPTVNWIFPQAGKLIITRIIQLLSIAIVFFSIKRINKTKVKNLIKSNIKTGLFLMILGIVIFTLWKINTPYPFPLNWDFFHHQTVVNQIKSGKLSIFTSQLSDTFGFNGYTTSFHVLMAWPQIVFNVNPLEYYWWLEFFHLLSVLAGSYFLAKKVFKNKLLPVIASLFSGFIFESFMAYSSLLLIPQTLVAVLFAYLLGITIDSQTNTKELIPGLIFLVLLHSIIGPLAVITLLFVQLILNNKQRMSIKSINIGIVLGVIILVIFGFLPAPIDLTYLNRGEALAFNLTIWEKWKYLGIFSGYLITILFPLGGLIILIKNNFKPKIILLVSILLLVPTIIFLPYVFKFIVLARYPILLISGYTFFKIITWIKSRILQLFVFLFLIFSLTILFINSTEFIRNVLKQDESVAQISKDEYQATLFLKNNYQESGVLLVSDPATQHILEPLSQINTQGGAYSSDQTRKLLTQINQIDNPELIKIKLFQVNDQLESKPNKVIFALSGRYFDWQNKTEKQKMDLSFNIWRPVDLSFNNRSYINHLKNSKHFTLLYSNSKIALLEVKK